MDVCRFITRGNIPFEQREKVVEEHVVVGGSKGPRIVGVEFATGLFLQVDVIDQRVDGSAELTPLRRGQVFVDPVVGVYPDIHNDSSVILTTEGWVRSCEVDQVLLYSLPRQLRPSSILCDLIHGYRVVREPRFGWLAN